MITRIQSMLNRSSTDKRIMPPTELFNEGWLLRTALDWFSDHPSVTHALAIPSRARWYSEALLASPFLARWRGDPLAETYTHADGTVGQFEIGGSGKGDLVLEPGAKHFVVLEAKLNSKLSSGIKNAVGYDQAARNIACMGQILMAAGIKPSDVETLGFYVVAPSSRIDRGVFAELLDKISIQQKVTKRVAAYNDSKLEEWLSKWFVPMLDRIQISCVSWEDVANTILKVEQGAGHSFEQFYDSCLEYNGLKR